MPQQVVTNGAVDLDSPASKVIVGLPFEADAKTLPLTMQNKSALGGGIKKNIIQAFLQVYRSSGVFVGPDFDNLTEYKQRTTEMPGKPPELKTEEIELRLAPTWQTEGSVCIRQADPLPLTVQGLVLNVST